MGIQKFSRLLPFAALAFLACSAVQAHSADASKLSPKAPVGQAEQRFSVQATPAIHAAPEFHPAAAVAALTLLLGGVAVLKGWRHE